MGYRVILVDFALVLGKNLRATRGVVPRHLCTVVLSSNDVVGLHRVLAVLGRLFHRDAIGVGESGLR